MERISRCHENVGGQASFHAGRAPPAQHYRHRVRLGSLVGALTSPAEQPLLEPIVIVHVSKFGDVERG